MSCGGNLVTDYYLYVCVMDDCRTSLWLSIYLISLYLSLLMMVNAFWMAMCCFKLFLKNLGHHILFYLLCEYNMSYCISFHGYIYLFTHTCCTPRIAKFRGSFCLDVCKSCIDYLIKIQIHAYIKGSSS